MLLGVLIGLICGALSLGAFSLSLDVLSGSMLQRLERGIELVGWRAILILLAFASLGGYLSSGLESPWIQAELGTVHLLVILIVTALLMAQAMVDVVEHLLPDELNLALLVCGIIWHMLIGAPVLDSLLGLIVAGGIAFLLALMGPVGMGDVKLVAALGAILGYPYSLYGFALGIVLGGVAAVVLLISKRLGRKDYMAYGPYLALGGWIFWMLMLL